MTEPQESTVDSSQSEPITNSEAVATTTVAPAVEVEPAEVPSSNSADADNFKVPSTPPKAPEKDLVVEAVQSIQQGKRHMIVADYRSAVPFFEHACQVLDSLYGTGSAECAEAYLNYGISLFELSRLEEGIMDGVVNVDSQMSSDEEGGDEEREEGEKGNEDNEDNEKANDDNEAEAKASSPEGSASDDNKVDIDLTQPSTSKVDASASAVTTNGEKSDEDDEADAANNVEIAWEVLSMAKNIYEDSPDMTKEIQLNLAEALQKLGEISIEWENNDNAVHLLSQCLEHRKAALEPDDRLIALTYHFLGIAFSFKNEIDRANSCFESALDVIQMRIKHLKEVKTDKMDQFAKDSHEREISQLEDLIPELTAKIEDIKEQMQSQFKTLESLQKESEKEEIKQVQPSQAKPVNNISHLIKRKKEDSDGVAENGNSEGSSIKKIRVEETQSGDSNGEATTTN